MSSEENKLVDPGQAQAIARYVTDLTESTWQWIAYAKDQLNGGEPPAVVEALDAIEYNLIQLKQHNAITARLVGAFQEIAQAATEQRDQAVMEAEAAKDEAARLQGEMIERERDAYSQGHDDGWLEGHDSVLEDDSFMRELEDDAIDHYNDSLINSAEWTADKLRTVGEIDMADQIENLARMALELRHEAEDLIEQGSRIAFDRRLIIDEDEPDDDEDFEDDEFDDLVSLDSALDEDAA